MNLASGIIIYLNFTIKHMYAYLEQATRELETQIIAMLHWLLWYMCIYMNLSNANQLVHLAQQIYEMLNVIIHVCLKYAVIQ